jgi:hypothetical protein
MSASTGIPSGIPNPAARGPGVALAAAPVPAASSANPTAAASLTHGGPPPTPVGKQPIQAPTIIAQPTSNAHTPTPIDDLDLPPFLDRRRKAPAPTADARQDHRSSPCNPDETITT